jgi:hypothetical protein
MAFLIDSGSILATEAKHSGTLRYNCVYFGVESPAVDSIDISPTMANLYGTDSNGLVAPRTPAQVLKIVYGGGDCSGGFYPNGMTGSVTCGSGSNSRTSSLSHQRVSQRQPSGFVTFKTG